MGGTGNERPKPGGKTEKARSETLSDFWHILAFTYGDRRSAMEPTGPTSTPHSCTFF